MRVWIDQDLCTGDGLCTDHCPEVFVLLEDGISYVRNAAGETTGPGGRASIVAVRSRHDLDVVAAALDCPGECIFIEPDDDDHGSAFGGDIEPAEIVGESAAGETAQPAR